MYIFIQFTKILYIQNEFIKKLFLQKKFNSIQPELPRTLTNESCKSIPILH